jgi:hypothetical protein
MQGMLARLPPARHAYCRGILACSAPPRSSLSSGARFTRRCQHSAGGQTTHSRLLELPRGTSRRFLSAEKRITEHFRHRSGAAQKVNLKTVSLFFRARFGIDAANICF